MGTSKFGTVVRKEYAFELLDKFYSGGGTLLDTARNYYEWVLDGRGRSEECVGKWVQSRNNRKKVIISTKGGVRNNGNHWIIDLSKEKLLAEVDESLDALQTDYIDIYLLHRDELSRSVEEIVDTLQIIAERAKTSYIGVANWHYDRIIEANKYASQHGLKKLEIVQTWWAAAEYTSKMWNDPNTTNMDSNTYKYMVAEDMIGMAYTSQCKGFFQKAASLGVNKLDKSLLDRISTPANIEILSFMKEYAKDRNITVTDVVNSYITSNKLKGIALVSCSKSEQLDDILEHCDYDLDQDAIAHIDRLKLA